MTTKNKQFYTFPMSFAQKRMYFLCQYAKENQHIFNIPILIKIEGEFELELAREALDKIVQKHEILRTSFKHNAEGFFQIVRPDSNYGFEVAELDGTDIKNRIKFDIKHVFNLSNDPLLKLKIYKNKKETYALFIVHHIIFDGWSQAILTKEFIQYYNNGDEPEVSAELPIQYVDYSVWQQEELTGEKLNNLLSYWKGKLKGANYSLNLPLDNPREKIEGYVGNVFKFNIEDDKAKQIKKICISNNISIQNFFLSVYAILISRYSNQEDIIIGSPFSIRSIDEIEDLIGLFVNTLPIRVELHKNISFVEVLKQVSKTVIEALDNSDLPLEQIANLMEFDRDVNSFSLFQVFYVYQNVPKHKLVVKDLDFHLQNVEHVSTQYDLSLLVDEISSGFGFKLEYDTRLFHDTTIERLINHFNIIVDRVLEDTKQCVHYIDFLTNQEREVLKIINSNTFEYPKASVVELFEKIVDEFPEKIALIYNDKKLSYGDLNNKANKLANYLINNKIGKGKIVALMIDRSLELIISLLGVLKANAAYIPIDTKLPHQRIENIIDDSHCDFLITDEISFKTKYCESISIKEFDFNKCVQGNVAQKPSLDDLLYVIYTSGTTGVPKGIKLSHGNIVNLLYHQYQKTTINFESVLQFASIGFDVATQEILSTLCNGGKLTIIDELIRYDFKTLFETIELNNIKTLFLPAAYLKLLSEEEKVLNAIPLCVKHIISAGEQLVINDKLKSKIEKQHFIIHNHYGPAETHVVTTYTIDEKSIDSDRIPIGTPVINSQVHILNKNLLQQPFNVIGEIYVSGSQVGLGYLGNDRLNNKVFLSISGHKTMYKTGDLGKLLPSGNIQYLRRIDNQIKIRGNRVELDEIIHVVNNYIEVQESTVVYNQEKNALICYYKSKGAFEVELLKKHIESILPSYMLPDFYLEVESFPMTISGKIDSKKLPLPVLKKKRVQTVPKNEVEKKLHEIWNDVLQLDDFEFCGTNNFFEMGGDSLKATQLIYKINDVLYKRVDLKEIFDNPVFENQADLIESKNAFRNEVLKPLPFSEKFPLSRPQTRMYLLWRMQEDKIAYNLTNIFKIQGEIDYGKLNGVFTKLISRHEILRTSFHEEGEGLIQKVHPPSEFNVIIIDTQEKDIVNLIENNLTPFDLKIPSQLDIKLYRKSKNLHYLAFDMHHIIVDGSSFRNIVHEFNALYRDEILPSLNYTYRDYVYNQDQVSMTQVQDYWIERLRNYPPKIKLKSSFKLNSQDDANSGNYMLELSIASTQKLKEKIQQQNSSFYIELISALYVVLNKYTYQEDIIIGTGVSGRDRSEFEKLVGMFVNMLPIRGKIKPDLSFKQFKGQIKDGFVQDLEHQALQFDVLIDMLKVKRELNSNPLFDIEFTFQNTQIPVLQIPGLHIEYIPNKAKDSVFDLSINGFEIEEKIKLYFHYSGKVYSQLFIQNFAKDYLAIIDQYIDNEEIKLNEFQINNDLKDAKLPFDVADFF